MTDLLQKYGIDHYLQRISIEDEHGKNKGLSIARIIAEHKSNYIVITREGEIPGVLAGSYRFTMEIMGGSPTVGDFVLVKIPEEKDRAVIYHLLPRKSAFIRQDARFSVSGVQILAANFDTVFICMSLNRDYNLSRLERYLALAKESGANIVVVLTKVDLCDDVGTQKEITQAVCGEIPVHTVSALTGEGLSELAGFFANGQTVVALGSSGVGKSSLVNAIFGQRIMDVKEIRGDDDRGRHTTVHRQIILLPSGGLYMDTPGLREVGLVNAEDAVSEIYADMETIIKQCRFPNCNHKTEPGCAVKTAIQNGHITESQYERYTRLKKEAAFLMRKETRKMKQQNKGPEAKRYIPGYDE